jgi:hypothetical protein
MIRVTFFAKDVLRNIDRYKKELKEKTKEVLIETAMKEVETVAKDTLTNDGHIDTGRLRASIHTSHWGKTKHAYKCSSTGAKTGRKAKKTSFDGTLSEAPFNELEVYVGTNVVYAHRIERLDPYLVPAYENGKKMLMVNLKKII